MRKFIFLVLCLCNGCAWQPNSWNVTWYEGDQFKQGQNMIGVGISGQIPQLPFTKGNK